MFSTLGAEHFVLWPTCKYNEKTWSCSDDIFFSKAASYSYHVRRERLMRTSISALPVQRVPLKITFDLAFRIFPCLSERPVSKIITFLRANEAQAKTPQEYKFRRGQSLLQTGPDSRHLTGRHDPRMVRSAARDAKQHTNLAKACSIPEAPNTRQTHTDCDSAAEL